MSQELRPMWIKGKEGDRSAIMLGWRGRRIE